MYSARYGDCVVLFGLVWFYRQNGYAKIKPSTPKVQENQRRKNGSLTQTNREESCTPVSSDTLTRLAVDHNEKEENKIGYYGPKRRGLTTL